MASPLKCGAFWYIYVYHDILQLLRFFYNSVCSRFRTLHFFTLLSCVNSKTVLDFNHFVRNPSHIKDRAAVCVLCDLHFHDFAAHKLGIPWEHLHALYGNHQSSVYIIREHVCISDLFTSLRWNSPFHFTPQNAKAKNAFPKVTIKNCFKIQQHTILKVVWHISHQSLKEIKYLFTK